MAEQKEAAEGETAVLGGTGGEREKGEDACGNVKLEEGRRPRAGGFRGGAACGGEHVEGSGTDTQR